VSAYAGSLRIGDSGKLELAEKPSRMLHMAGLNSGAGARVSADDRTPRFWRMYLAAALQ